MSSKRSWPSLFLSKPCNNLHKRHHDHSRLLPNSNSSEVPKLRWNPKPEQVKILEDIFNSGMVNPPRDEISKITCQLQEYGKVGDANVFYWFQNRKSRMKYKNRSRQSTRSSHRSRKTAPPPAKARPPSLASSSERSPPHVQKKVCLGVPSGVYEMTNFPNMSVTDSTVFTPTGNLLKDPFLLPVQNETLVTTQGQCFSDINSLYEMINKPTGHLNYAGFLQELMVNQGNDQTPSTSSRAIGEVSDSSFTAPSMSSRAIAEVSDSSFTATAPCYTPVGDESMAPTAALRMQVFIDNEVYDVGPGPVNIREAFGNKILVHNSGQRILTDEWGLTLQQLQHGHSYYLLNA